MSLVFPSDILELTVVMSQRHTSYPQYFVTNCVHVRSASLTMKDREMNDELHQLHPHGGNVWHKWVNNLVTS